MTKPINMTKTQELRIRRYRRATISENALASILTGSLDLVLPPGSGVIGVQPNSNLYPTGVSLIVYHPDFDVVLAHDEPPFDPSLAKLKMRGRRKEAA